MFIWLELTSRICYLVFAFCFFFCPFYYSECITSITELGLLLHYVTVNSHVICILEDMRQTCARWQREKKGEGEGEGEKEEEWKAVI